MIRSVRRLQPGLLVLLLGLAACAPEAGLQRDPATADVTPQRRGHPPLAVEFQYAFTNVPTADYYPFEGLTGLAWGEDGSLVVCDAGRGRVHILDPRTRTWRGLDNPGVRGFRPLAARIDGFKVLVLDGTSRAIYRYDIKGTYQDRIVDLTSIDPAYETTPRDFDLDRDGRVVVTDAGEQQVLMLDTFLALQGRVGHPGPHPEQFDQPSGICYLPDGGFMVADTGNRRLQRFNRLGYGVAVIGGFFDAHNPFVAPQGLAADRWGNVYVADVAAGVVQVVDGTDAVVMLVGPDEALEGSLLAPISVAVGPDQQLAVADRERRAVLVYRLIYE
ncbi:MAG: NHL repeat-containing protein [Candidatus Krumholzibacteriia bacterium]